MNPAHPFLAAAAQVLAATAAQATEEKPLWEVGAGTFTFPACRGADKNSNWFLPVPYFTYQGDFLKADRNGIRGSFFDTDRLDLTVSAFLSPPSGSDNIPARAGMPDLKAAFEIGQQGGRHPLALREPRPLRQAAPAVARRLNGRGAAEGCRLGLPSQPEPGHYRPARMEPRPDAGPVFGNQRQNAYYYSVASQYATPARPAYKAASGYTGSQFLVGVSRCFPKFWLGAFASFDNLSGATISDSPLVLEKNNFAAGIAVSWIFGESSTRVMVND